MLFWGRITQRAPCVMSRRPTTRECGRERGFAALLVAATLSLAACKTTGTPVSENDETALAASPANIASLSDVVARNPNDAQAYNMRGSVLGRAGRNQEALARLRQGDRDRFQLRAGLCQSRAGLPPDRQARSRARRLQSRADDRLDLRDRLCGPRHGLSPAGPFARRAERLQPRDPDEPEQCAGLLQSRTALSGTGTAQIRDRRLHDHDRP